MKNILDFEGKPMIAWTIDAAIQAGLYEKIVVSTDDEQIASISIQHGAEVPFLRKAAFDDISPVSDATLSTLLQCEEYYQTKFDHVTQLFAVCPLRNHTQIKDAFDFFCEKNAEFLISCYEFNWMNPWWAYTIDEKNIPTSLFPDASRMRSQDLPKVYSPTGAIWMANSETLKKTKSFYGPGHVFFPIDWKSAVDIDNYEDIEIAKAFFKLLKRDR
jgi:N-acylneuraminate cytidylyltransferase